MKKFIIIAATLLSMCSSASYAQKKAENTYNLQKAYEVLQKDNDEEQALDLLGKQIEETPRNIEALLLRAKVYRGKGKYGDALADLNAAIKINDRKNEIKLSTLHWWKAAIYMDLKEYEKAADLYRMALNLARKDHNGNIQNISFSYAQSLFEQKKYSEADAVYRQMLKENDGDAAAMVGLARNMYERGECQEAVELLEKSRKLNADYSEPYHYLAKAYDKMGATDKAIDAIVEWLDRNDDACCEYATGVLLKHKSYSLAKIREKVKKSEDGVRWRAELIAIYEKCCDYELAIREYDALENEYGKSSYIYVRRADCYSNLGLTDKALEEAGLALGGDDDYMAYSLIGSINRQSGRYNDAIEALSKSIELEPMSAWGYYTRGWCHELSGDDEKALEDYNLGIDLDKTDPYIFVARGELLLKNGNTEDAKKDFETVLQLDTVAKDNSCRMYALHLLGRDDEAEEWMQKIIDDNPRDCGNYYDKACLYSKMGKLDEAVEAMEKCLDMGYCCFDHIEHDDDVDAIRERDDYKALIEEYKAKLEKRISGLREEIAAPREMTITEVAISRHSGGTFEIPCTVNGLSLNMIFDTGASDVTISSVEANFMLKNGHLSRKDIKGKNHYQTASGDILEGTVITLKEVKVGDAILHNVNASVVRNQKAPLLLGQSVLEKFGTITIDNINNKLLIKH